MKISKNFDRGIKITSVEELYNIAIARGSVWNSTWGIKAARAICNMPFWTLKKAILKGSIYRTVKRR